MDEILFRLVNSGFLELPGMRVDSTIPIPEYLINEIIASLLQGNKSIRELRVSVAEENRVRVQIKSPIWPWPLNMSLRLEKSLDFARSPTALATIENNLLLVKLGAVVKALPKGIRLQGGRIVADLQDLVSAPEQKRLLSLVRSAEVRTEPARLILDVKIEVD